MSDTKPGDGVVRVRLSHGMSDQKCWCHSDNGGTHMLVTVEEWENQAKRIEELEKAIRHNAFNDDGECLVCGSGGEDE